MATDKRAGAAMAASAGVSGTPGAMKELRRANTAEKKPGKQKFDWSQLPDVIALLKPRRAILALSFLLMAINRVSGLVLPASSKYLVDDVINKKQTNLLAVIVGVVVAATILQGLTSYALTQLLSKSSQRMITELRIKVQAHIGRLPVSF